MRVIGFEEHYATEQFLAGPGREFIGRLSQAAAKNFIRDTDRLLKQLTELGDGRIAEMDAAGVDVAVLSLTAPGVEQLAAADAVRLRVTPTITWPRR
jgi:predicted TIM-barrel fold metal-dependent hydrolase